LVSDSSEPDKIILNQNHVDVTVGMIKSCTNIPVQIDGITQSLVAKIPVVLAKLSVQLNVSGQVTLPELAIEIKNIDNKLKITQCLLLQETNTLFIKGFIRKSIDYSTIEKRPTKEGLCGDIHRCTIDTPFECTTPIEFNGFPPAKVIPMTSTEFEYLDRNDLADKYAKKDGLLSGDISELNQTSTEYFNDLPYCKIISSKVVDSNEYLNRRIIRNGPLGEGVFKEFEQKMVIDIVLKVLQKRLVQIN